MQHSSSNKIVPEARYSLRDTKLQLLTALLPGVYAGYWFFGAGILLNLGGALITALLFKTLVLATQRKSLRLQHAEFDNLTIAVLIAISIPTISPWWISILGTFFSLSLKQIIDQNGYRPINPAMAGYLVLLIAFPNYLSNWITPSNISPISLNVAEFIKIFTTGKLPVTIGYDDITSPTPLGTLHTVLEAHQLIPGSLLQSINIGWQWVALAYLCGGLWLVYRDIIEWVIPASILGSIGFFALLGHTLNDAFFAAPLIHLLNSTTMLCAFFIATDPRSSPNTSGYRLTYGLMIGTLIYFIRLLGIYPDGSACAVVLTNLAIPLFFQQRRKRI